MERVQFEPRPTLKSKLPQNYSVNGMISPCLHWASVTVKRQANSWVHKLLVTGGKTNCYIILTYISGEGVIAHDGLDVLESIRVDLWAIITQQGIDIFQEILTVIMFHSSQVTSYDVRGVHVVGGSVWLGCHRWEYVSVCTMAQFHHTILWKITQMKMAHFKMCSYILFIFLF